MTREEAMGYLDDLDRLGHVGPDVEAEVEELRRVLFEIAGQASAEDGVDPCGCSWPGRESDR